MGKLHIKSFKRVFFLKDFKLFLFNLQLYNYKMFVHLGENKIYSFLKALLSTDNAV